MSRPQSRARRQAAFLEEAKRMYERMEDWYDEHPEASFGELEEEARKRRRELMGSTLAQLVNGRDTGAQVELPKCKQCGNEMDFEGYRKWRLHGLEGDSTLERAYYACPHCEGETLFPPGSEAEVTVRSLE
jgi:DNA-directed RNA polymerase subunit RPC12/RpoP